MTHGADGAEAWTAAAHVHVPGHRVEVVDTVGAGDTLMGTLLAQLAAGGHTGRRGAPPPAGEALSAALGRAVAAAALNCMASGCAPPTPDAVAAFLKARAAP